MLAGKWSADAIFATISLPIFIAALATVCVRFSRYADAAPAERTPPPFPPPHPLPNPPPLAGKGRVGAVGGG
jgi:hypothetical protein